VIKEASYRHWYEVLAEQPKYLKHEVRKEKMVIVGVLALGTTIKQTWNRYIWQCGDSEQRKEAQYLRISVKIWS
jgi:hypothetical protein